MSLGERLFRQTLICLSSLSQAKKNDKKMKLIILTLCHINYIVRLILESHLKLSKEAVKKAQEVRATYSMIVLSGMLDQVNCKRFQKVMNILFLEVLNG